MTRDTSCSRSMVATTSHWVFGNIGYLDVRIKDALGEVEMDVSTGKTKAIAYSAHILSWACGTVVARLLRISDPTA